MGCGASNDPKIAVVDPSKQNYNKSSRVNNNGFQKVELKNTYNNNNEPNNRPSSEKSKS